MEDEEVTLMDDLLVKRSDRLVTLVKRLMSDADSRNRYDISNDSKTGEWICTPKEQKSGSLHSRFYDAIGNMVVPLDCLVQLYKTGKRKFDRDFIEGTYKRIGGIKKYLTARSISDNLAMSESYESNGQSFDTSFLRKSADLNYQNMGHTTALDAYAELCLTKALEINNALN